LLKQLASGALKDAVLGGLHMLEAAAGCAWPAGDGCAYAEDLPVTWGRLDPEKQARPAMLYVKIDRAASPPGASWVKHPVAGTAGLGLGGPFGTGNGGNLTSCTKHYFPTKRTLQIADYLGIYSKMEVALPRQIPEGGLLVPIVLEPKIPEVTYVNPPL